MSTLHNFLFIALPYITMVVFFVGTIYRYRGTKFKFSSLSSEFLERRKLFWGSVPFHWGMGALFVGHLIAFLVPSGVLAWNSHPVRLLILEISGFIFGLTMLWGIVALIARRWSNDRIRGVTNSMDVVIEIFILAQVILGLYMAYNYRWGSSWFAAVLTPYLWSIFKLNPQIDAVVALPWVVKLHVSGAFMIILLIPFTRLVHLLVFPVHYLWRNYQRVIWYWDRRTIRQPDAPVPRVGPRNN